VRVFGERQILMVAIKGQLYLLPEPGPAKFENIDQDGRYEARKFGKLLILRTSYEIGAIAVELRAHSQSWRL
jgi:hypothetical protein